ncbi:hypothetical protein Tco_0305490 [Tanacetum coccineum]
MDTQVPQPSDPSKHVADEVVHKELGDSLVRAATTASSLEAEQDNGNITKTQSKATPNESSSLGTTSGGGPRCQETMGDTITQTRFENVSKLYNDSLLARGNTLRSDEDRLKLNEFMELCTNLQKKVLDLEKTKTTQANEIDSLKRRVKKLEKKDRSRTHKLKRLYKVGLSAWVESSRDEESLGEDASKQGRRINAIDADEGITLVNVQDDAKMFDVNTFTHDEVFAEQDVTAKDVNLTVDEVTLAQALAALKSVKLKDKGKGIMVEEPVKTMKKKDLIRLDEETAKRLQAEFDEEERHARAKIEADHELAQRLQAEEQEELFVEEKAKLFQQLLEQRRKHFVAKSAEKKRNKPPTQAQPRKIMCTYLKNMEGKNLKDLKNKSFDSIQKMFDRAFKRVNTFVNFRTDLVEGSSKRAGEELEQESTKKQKADEDKDTAELQSLMEVILDKEEVAIDAVSLATKSPRIVDQKIHKEVKKSYYQIIRADGKSQMYRIFSQMIKSFDREDLEDLYKLVKARYGSTRLVEDMDYLLWNDMKIMFEPHVEDEVWKLQNRYKVLEWKLYNSCGVHFLRMQSIQIYMLVEKRYPLTPPTITDMLNKKLQGRIVGIKSLLNAVSITAALIDVNAAQSKLVLLENFNENYSKCLRLLYKVNAAEGVNAASEEVSTAELVSTAYVIYKMAEENIPAPTRSNDQLVPVKARLPHGKSYLLLDLKKLQKNPIFRISVDILQNAKFFRAFTTSTNVRSIYIHQFWNTLTQEAKYGIYSFQLDEQWFPLNSDLLREALQINPVDPTHPFVSPPPPRCLIGKTSGSDKPRHPVLQILWGIVTRSNVDYAKLLWEEFMQGIQTFFSHRASLSIPSTKSTPHVIPYCRFTKLIIYYLGSRHNIHQRPESPVHITGDDFPLGNLKFIPKGEKDEVFRKPIPKELITEAIQTSPYYKQYMDMVAGKSIAKRDEQKKTTSIADKPKKPTPVKKPAPDKQTKPVIEKSTKPSPVKKASKGKVRKVRKGKSSLQLVDEPEEEQVHPEPEPQVEDEEYDLQ